MTSEGEAVALTPRPPKPQLLLYYLCPYCIAKKIILLEKCDFIKCRFIDN